ncbi:hypothetical protein LAJ19_07835 [Deinococcus taeanensis]|uniref:hypothetical protein n=1 Tax=Deinococcus taeanensis TaxID=2737050 RepID=UPI001CDC0FFE|nr:hypothetical protein [Deinococcus taeanensis]UBV41576.1 hypothetical protein LAJ19_07835 [Deinococcus taeanensis]
MKRVLCLLPLLAACGVQAPPAPLVGDLLSAPTALNVRGQVVTLDTTSAAGTGGFGVKVRLNAAREPLPALRLDGVFVVSGGGLWKSPLAAQGAEGSAWGRGAPGVQPGEPVQVVVRLRDVQGRVLWLRDDESRVGTAP